MQMTRSIYVSRLAMVTVVAITALSGFAPEQLERGGTNSAVGQGTGFLPEGQSPMHPAREVARETFTLITPAGSVPADGWPKFQHGDLMLSFGAPAPAVPLVYEEKLKWGWDVATFKVEKLRDRKVLYVYDLTDTKMAEMVLNALQKTVGAVEADKEKVIWTAFGVKYDIEKFETIGNPELYTRAAVPIKFDDATFKFLKHEHDPKTLAAAVGAATKELPSGAFANFQALTDWSAMAEDLKVELKDPEGRKTTLESAYLRNAWQGPFAWEKLKPLMSFIAVDQDLDIEGVNPQRLLTSERAWVATID